MSEVLLSVLRGNLSDQYPEAFTPRRVSRSLNRCPARISFFKDAFPCPLAYDGDVSVRRSRVNDEFSPALWCAHSSRGKIL